MFLAETSPAGMGIVSIILYVVVIGGMFYFMFYSRKKEQKKIAEVQNSVEIGASVLTTSGFYGVVIDVEDDTVIVEFGNNKNCRIPMKKEAIVQVEKAGN